jgi:hypothetical protein
VKADPRSQSERHFFGRLFSQQHVKRGQDEPSAHEQAAAATIVLGEDFRR